MSFYKKIFLSFIVTVFIISSLCIWGYHFYATRNATENFEKKYTLLTETIAETLNQLDKSADLFLLNSARMVQRLEVESNDNTNWKKIAKKLKLTHIFIANSKGDFIVSTNEPPNEIPNILSFCKDYKNLLLNSDKYETTPIIPPTPEPYPYKFLITSNLSKTKYLEVAVKVDFIGNTLKKLLERDQSILKIQLFTPNGINLGSFGPKAEEYKRFRANKSEFQHGDIVHSANKAIAYTKVPSNVTTCCECDQLGLSVDNKYYYLLKTEIDKSQLNKDYKDILIFSIIIQLLSLLAGWIISSKIASSLSSRISSLDSLIEGMIETGRVEDLNISGDDEIANLGSHFNKLLKKISSLNTEVIASKDLELRFKFARMIAHDLAAPIEAIKFLKERIKSKDPEESKILNSVSDKLSQLTLDLRNTILEINQAEINTDDHPLSRQDIIKLTKEVITIFNVYTLGRDIEITFTASSSHAFALLNPYLYSRVISNILTNSFEAIGDRGTILIEIKNIEEEIHLIISDKKLNKDRKKFNYGLGENFISIALKHFNSSYKVNKELNSYKTSIILPKYSK